MKRSLSVLLLSSALLVSCGSGSSTVEAHARLDQLVADAQYDALVAELSSGDAAQSMDAHTWLVLAQARLGQDELPKAERALRDGLAAHPGDLQLSLLLSRLYQSLGQIPKSLGTLQAASAQGAEDPRYLLDLGVALGRSNDLVGAQRTFNRAREAGANESDVEFNLGVILAASGDHGGAVGHFEAALAAAPDHMHVKRELARSLFHELPGDVERAKQVAATLDEVLEVAPEDWRAWALLGETQLALDDPVAAQAYLTNALKFSKNEPTVEALYVQAARAAKEQLKAEGIIDTEAAPRRGAPPIPASVQERIKKAQREEYEKAQQEAGTEDDGA